MSVWRMVEGNVLEANLSDDSETFCKTLAVTFGLLPCSILGIQLPQNNSSIVQIIMTLFECRPLPAVPFEKTKQILHLISVQIHTDWTESPREKQNISTGQMGHIHGIGWNPTVEVSRQISLCLLFFSSLPNLIIVDLGIRVRKRVVCLGECLLRRH